MGVLPAPGRHRRRRAADEALRRPRARLRALPPPQGRHAAGGRAARGGGGADGPGARPGRAAGGGARRPDVDAGAHAGEGPAAAVRGRQGGAGVGAVRRGGGGLPGAVRLRTCSEDRRDYILHPPSGESLDAASEATVRALRDRHGGRWDAQLVISDGLDPRSLMDEGHLSPFLARLRAELDATGWRVAPEVLVVKHGRVRAGYQVGRLLFGAEGDLRPRALVHVIGERPGSGHHAFSAYLTAPDADTWAKPGAVDHDRTRLIAGISDTSVRPEDAAVEAARMLGEARTSITPWVSGVGLAAGVLP
ncbi:ethanolamine ammonia-lyase light chain EutC [Corallococcus sp. 4LFB]|uniref:ethanolamine ammonia-lyase light chain EutC n=1 Tax=Corallococcus sp. 4LFB TaxID=3383249 RepID=UPI003974CA81